MSNLLIAFLFAVGCSAWIYSKVYRQTGGLAKQALIVAGVAGVVILLIAWSIIGMILH